ncbi:Integrase catalytic core [Arabidopsis suecica]|uniref:Integrase catalytic core n=1 Tax=Arabidopsis suecica TaxID=45249 RepID=A0A8T1X974_ARASU|nr:Integrase catalytic core [Arabidopsis suecica]
MRPPPDCRPSVGASAPKGTCRWLSPFGGSVVRTALNYNYHRAAGRILCRRLKYATGYLLKLTPPSCKKASPAPIRTMKVRGNENWSEKSSISTREATPAPIRTMKVRANENWSEISTRKASPAPIRTMKVRGNENWYEKSSISTSNRQPAPIRTMKVRGIENWYEKSSISTTNRQPVRGIVEKKKRSVRGVVDLYVAHDLLLTKTLKTLTLKIAVTIHRRHYSSATLFIGDTVHRRYCSSRLLFIAATVHRGYYSSRLLFIAATVHRGYYSSPLLFIAITVHRRYCSSRLLFIAATVHRGYYSSPLLFIAATVHRRYCSSRLLFIAATVHRGYYSSPLLFIAATVHRRYCSSRLLFIAATIHRRYCSSRYCSSSVLFIAATVHHGTVHRRHCSSRYCLRFVAAAPQRIRKNPKNLTTSKVIDHTAVTVVDGKDVVVATITHPAVGTTITVDVDPIPAVVEGEDDVVFPNHNTRPNEYVIDVVLKGRGCGHYNSSGRGNHYNRGCRPNSGRGRGRGRCDIRLDGFHIETKGEGNKEFLNIIEITKGHKKVLETIPALSTSLYYAKIDMIEANMAMNKEFIEKFTLWHDRLGHPGHSMMRKLITNSKWHTLREKRVIPKNLTCEACSQGKLIIRPSPAKVNKETLNFLERIQGDICGPIHPPCGTFRYFMVLIDASTRWSHVCLLSTRNQGFARLLAQIIRLRAHFPDFPLKTIRLDNAGEFTSQAFNDYCMSMGVSVEHPVAHVHTQNGLAESFIKRIQLIARPLLMRSKLPVAAWGHTVLHASELIRIRPSSEHRYSPSQLLMGHEPDISHLKTFGCAVYVPIAPPHRTKMGPKRRMGIYVGFDSPTIIKYLEPTTGDLFKARYADCHFNESEFPTLGGETNKLGKDIKEISWNQTSLNWQDPRTLACESEVQKIINLQKLANELPDSFVDPKKVTKSYIPACNAPVRIDIQKGINEIATESNAQVHWIIYMRLPEGIELKDKDKKVSRDQYCIRLNKSLYGLKQSGRMWYNRLSDYLVREGYKNDPISPCIFIKKFANEGFVIIAVYVDDLNILGTSGEIAQTVEYLKKEFEMKDLGKTKFCLGLQLEYVNNGILVHQKAYTEKVLKRFNMDQAHPLSSPMVVRSLGLDSDSFGPKKDEEEVLGPEVPYLSAIGALMYLASHTRPDICFAVNLLCLNLVHDQPKGTGKTVRPSDRRNYRRKIFPATFPAIGFVAVFEFFQQFSDKNCCVVAENGRVMRGMTWILRGLGVAVYWESAWYTEMSPRASFHPVAEENGRVMTWADMDSPRPWVAVRAGCYVVRVSRRHIQFTFCGCSWQPSFDGKWISAGSDTRLPVLCVSFALRLRYPQPRLDGPEYFGGVGERLMFLGQLNVRRMSGDRIASVCRLRARAPNYLPPILLSYFTGDVTLDDRIRGLCCVPN